MEIELWLFKITDYLLLQRNKNGNILLIISGQITTQIIGAIMVFLENATKKDVNEIVENKIAAFNLESRTFGSGCDGGPPGYDSVDDTLEGVEDCIYYKVILEGRNIGSFFLIEIDKKTIELADFVIHPDYQNKGYGKTVLELMEKAHPEVNKWTLETPKYSVKNRYLYKKHGYKEIGYSDCGELVQFQKIIG